jgi:hypothetical protein
MTRGISVQRRWQMGGGGVRRGNTLTSQTRGKRGEGERVARAMVLVWCATKRVMLTAMRVMATRVASKRQ